MLRSYPDIRGTHQAWMMPMYCQRCGAERYVEVVREFGHSYVHDTDALWCCGEPVLEDPDEISAA
jgi:hypothetical protein